MSEANNFHKELRGKRMKQHRQAAIECIDTAQYLINYSTVAIASVAGGFAESLAHSLQGNGWIMGIPLALVSVGAATTAAVTGKRWVWAIYTVQLLIGLLQFSTISLAALSLSSLVGAVAAGYMLADKRTSQRQDKQSDNQLTVELAKIQAEKEVRIAKHSRTEAPDNSAQVASKRQQAKNMSANGMTQKEIATQLDLSERTIRRYLADRKADTVSATNGHKEILA